MITRCPEGLKLRPGLYVWVLEGRYRFQVLRELNANTQDIPAPNLLWWSEPVRVVAVRRKDGAAFNTFETIKVSRNFNLSTSIVRKGPQCVDIMRTVLSYAVTF